MWNTSKKKWEHPMAWIRWGTVGAMLIVMGGLSMMGGWFKWGEAYTPPELRRKLSTIILNGKKVRVLWPDGDTFRLILPMGRGPAARLRGYNTLENYGPVHKWGKWNASDLYRVGNLATKVARSRAWKCKTLQGSGGYGRLLADCPGLAAALISKGLAHVFSVQEAGDPKLLKLQRKAMQQRLGIWAKGTPSHIVTSVHSASLYRRRAYHRLISTRTGGSNMYRHSDSYNSCAWVCLKGSCMRYVPYKRRYGSNKASCLRVKRRPASRPASP